MTFSESKRSVLREKKNKCGLTFILAIITASAFILPLIIRDGGYFLYCFDSEAGGISLYKICREAILSGNIGYSLKSGLGADFIGSYGHLISSPFFLLTLLFPSSFAAYLQGPLLILKFGCAALTSHLYIRRFTHRENSAVLGGLLYAFSSFSLYQVYFNCLYETAIVFPLLLLSLELLITERKKCVFALAVFLTAVTGIYYAFGTLVFCAVYYIIRITSHAVKFKFSVFFTVIFETAVGLLMSAAVVLPVFYTVLFGKAAFPFLNGWSAAMYESEQLYAKIITSFFFPPELPGSTVFFPLSNSEFSSVAGWLPLFSLCGVISYCSAKKGSWLKRAIITCGFFALIPVLNSVFNMFNTEYSSSWFYMPLLLICLATVFAAEDKEISFKPGFLITAFITLFTVALIGLMPDFKEGKTVFGIYNKVGENNEYALAFWIICGFAVVSLALFGLILLSRRKNVKAFLKLATVGVMVIAVAYSTVYISYSKGIFTAEADYSLSSDADLDIIKDGNFRVDYYGCPDNTAVLLGLPSLNGVQSYKNAAVKEFYQSVGVNSADSVIDTDKWQLRSLLSVKYLLNAKDGEQFANGIYTQMPGYNYALSSEEYNVYENENYIPYGFSYEYCISKSDLIKNFDVSERAAVMLKAVVLEDSDFNQLSKYFKNLNDIKKEVVLEETVQESAEEPDANEDGETTDKTEAEENLKEERNKGITLETDYESSVKDINALRQTAATDFSYNSRLIKCNVTRNGETLVFFSVPYTEGFTAKVNGKPAKTFKTNIGFTAVLVGDGNSEIELSYRTPGLVMGINTSLFGLAVFLIYLLFVLVRKKKPGNDNIYPEGERLIKKWCRDELDDEIKEDEEESILDDLPEDFFNSEDFIDNFPNGFKINTDINEDA